MREIALVGSGGFLGAVARYYLSGYVLHLSGAARFPWGTLAVNTVGCLAMGIVASLAEHLHLLSAEARLLLITGVLGGFTTFSAFAYESYFLAREQLWYASMVNVVLQVVLGVGAVWGGHWLISRLTA